MSETLLGLVNNAALLLALTVLYDTIPLKKTMRSRILEVVTGLFVGAIGLAVMLTPWRFSEGVIFDTRSILLSTTGLFFGLIPTAIAVLMTGALRIYQGGAGALMGVSVILTSASLGLIWRYYLRLRKRTPRGYELYGFGIVVHVAMLLWTIALPREIRFDVLGRIWLPVMAIYPIGTVLLGLLLTRQRDRSQWEQELREERDRFARVAETSPVGIVMLARTGQIEYANARAEQVLGLSRAAMAGRTYNAPEWKVTDVDGGPFPDEALPFRRVMDAGEPVRDVVHAIEWPDGQRVLLSINAAPLADEAGQVDGMVASVEDITTRVRARAALRESEARFRSLYDTMTELVVLHEIVYDPGGRPVDYRIVDCNLAFTQITGIPRDVAIGALASELYAAGEPPYLEIYARVAETGAPAQFETFFPPMDKHLSISAVSSHKGTFFTIASDITERVRTEEALRASQKFLDTVLNSVAATVFTVTIPGWRIELVNQAVRSVFGYEPEEVIGKSTRMLYPDEAGFLKFGQAMEAALAAGQERFQQEQQLVRKDGRTLWSDAYSTVVRSGDAFTHVVSVVYDITARVKAQEALRALSARQEALLAAIPEIIMEVDERKVYTWANEAGYEFFGPDVLGKEAAFYFEGEQDTYRIVQPLFDGTDQTIYVESWQRRKDGQKRLLGWWCRSLQDAEGRITGTLSTARDITESRRAEELIRDLAKFPAENPSPVLRIGHDGEVLYFNRRGEPILELWQTAVGGPAPAEWQQHVRAVLETGERKELELTCGDRVISFFLTPITEGGYVNLYGRDVTERKRAEQALRQLNLELEQRVADRTAKLEAKTQELEAFAYSVSHDLKAPLRGIDGYSSLLQTGYAAQLDEDGRLFLQNIRQAARNMHQLIDDLLAYSRLERREMTLRPVDLGGLVESLLAEFAPQIEAGAVEVQVQLPCDQIQADFESLGQVLRNLIDNALKFAADARVPRIEIGGRIEPLGCVIWVRDNGIGFDMRHHERIFEIFQRLHRVEEYPGTGIGLAIVRKAMMRMGGRVWAESAAGQGATFYLEFPRR